MKVLVIISRIITGLVFTFSGFVKAVDPVGTEIKFGDYFNAMGLDFLMPYALIFSFLLNAAELVIGLMLIFNVFPKLAAWSAFGFLAIFTPLTLWLAVADPVSDCGCFGDAITLSNWQTFWKNVIFLGFVLVLIIWGKEFKSKLNFKKSMLGFGLFIILSLGFEFYNFINLPILDFRPYNKGVNIIEASTIPEDAKQPVYEVNFLYKNIESGDIEEFTYNNYPWEDSLNWEFISYEEKLIEEGYEPPIHDFNLTNLIGDDITEEILNDKNLSLIFVMHHITNEFEKVGEQLFEIAGYANKNDLQIYTFTSSETSVIESVIELFPKNVIICTGDDTMLKTLIRSNPGFILIKDAVILEKFHHRNIPNIENITKYK